MPLILIIAIILARISRIILAEPGVMPNLALTILWSLLIIAPSGLLLGLLFVILVKQIPGKNEQTVSLAYIVESIGFFLGALVFLFFIFQ